MRFFKKLLWIALFAWIVIAFLPKANLFYLGENYLKSYKIVMNKEKLNDYFGFFEIKDSEIYYDSLHVGNIDKILFIPAVMYNSISLKNANFSDSMKQFVPKNIESLHVRYSPFYPIGIFLSSRGDFGEISGNVNLYKRTLKLVLEPTENFAKNYSSIASQFKKQEGTYIYETTF